MAEPYLESGDYYSKVKATDQHETNGCPFKDGWQVVKMHVYEDGDTDSEVVAYTRNTDQADAVLRGLRDGSGSEYNDGEWVGPL